MTDHAVTCPTCDRLRPPNAEPCPNCGEVA